jgi:hypothetical protein
VPVDLGTVALAPVVLVQDVAAPPLPVGAAAPPVGRGAGSTAGAGGSPPLPSPRSTGHLNCTSTTAQPRERPQQMIELEPHLHLEHGQRPLCLHLDRLGRISRRVERSLERVEHRRRVRKEVVLLLLLAAWLLICGLCRTNSVVLPLLLLPLPPLPPQFLLLVWHRAR